MGLFGKKKKSASVGMYGKHPMADDFLRLNASSAEVRGLDEWLSGALPAAGRLVPDWENTYASFPTVCFVCGGTSKSSTYLVGALAPSTDRIGRQYPLILFAEVDEASLVNGYPAVPYARFLEEAEALLTRRGRLSRDSLLQAACALAPPDGSSLQSATGRHQQFLEGTSGADALAAMFAHLGDGVDQARHALGILREACRSISPKQPLPGFGVRCPIGERTGSERRQHAALWLAVLQRLLPVRLVPNVLWSGNVLLAYFGRLPAKALTALWHTGWQDDTLYDLGKERNDKQRLSDLPLDAPLSTLLGLLK
jgi:type VI secretion system protein ImpM